MCPGLSLEQGSYILVLFCLSNYSIKLLQENIHWYAVQMFQMWNRTKTSHNQTVKSTWQSLSFKKATLSSEYSFSYTDITILPFFWGNHSLSSDWGIINIPTVLIFSLWKGTEVIISGTVPSLAHTNGFSTYLLSPLCLTTHYHYFFPLPY